MKNPFQTSLVVSILIFLLGNVSGYYYGQIQKNAVSPASISNQPKSEPQKDTPSKNTFWDFSNSRADLNIFWQVWDILKKDYFDQEDLDTQKQVYGAIKGMVKALDDPYTLFMTPEETKEFSENLAGKLEGIGAELNVKEGNLIVVSAFKGSPAEKSGLKPGDIIYKINEETANEMSLLEAISKIRGPKGSHVALTIIRKDTSKPLEVNIIRDRITIPSSEIEFKENIAVVALNQFNEQTMPDFLKIAGQILTKKPIGIIIDLRYNGGGYLETSVELLSWFFADEKKAVIIKQRDAAKNEIIYTSGKGKLSEIPIVVLINQGSASASEIFAGAIQDHKRGLIIGEKSYGKGSVQQIEELEDGSSLRITIAKWFTPSDRSIDDVGILPDRIVGLSDDDITNDRDPQLDEAISYLKGLN